MKRICLVLAVMFAPAAGAAYKCVDEKGVTHIGDTPPAACANVILYEMTPSGTMLRKIDPTPTPEQLKQRQEESERLKEAAKAAADQKRKDDALLNSFAAEREFDVARDRNIEPLNGRIKSAQERLKAVDKRIEELEGEMEFYKAGKSKAAKERSAPIGLVHELERARAERTTLDSSVVRSIQEIADLKVKFEADKKRWIALKGNQGKMPDAPKSEPKKTSY